MFLVPKNNPASKRTICGDIHSDACQNNVVENFQIEIGFLSANQQSIFVKTIPARTSKCRKSEIERSRSWLPLAFASFTILNMGYNSPTRRSRSRSPAGRSRGSRRYSRSRSPPRHRRDSRSRSPPRRRRDSRSRSPPRRRRDSRSPPPHQDRSSSYRNNSNKDRGNRRDNQHKSNGGGNKKYEWGRPEDNVEVEEEPIQKEEANFGLSGKLAAETNTVKGVELKYNEPPEAEKPKTKWRLYVFKGDEQIGENSELERFPL